MAEAPTTDDTADLTDNVAHVPGYDDSPTGTAGLAWAVVLALTVAAGAFILMLAFSTQNTEFSVDGEKSVSAKEIAEPAGP